MMASTLKQNINQSILNSYSTDFKKIIDPVEADLKDFEAELLKQIKSSISKNQIESEIINYFFKKSGKYLRPLLVFLSAKAGTVHPVDKEIYDKIIKLAVSVELIHNASLVHDDILDDSTIRRDRETLNKKYGNHVAVLAGDMLYSLAFSTVIEIENFKIMKKLCYITEQMCVGEIYNLKSFLLNSSIANARKFEDLKDMYLKIIKKKTALFMSACCECGALLSGADLKVTEALASYGYNLGMIYQFVDDYVDNDFVWDKYKNEFFSFLKKYNTALETSLEALQDSKYKQSLYDLHSYIINRIKNKKA